MKELIIILMLFMVAPVLFYGIMCLFNTWLESQGEE